MGTVIGITLACHMVGSAIGIYAGGFSFQLTGSYANIFLGVGILELIAASFALGITQLGLKQIPAT